MEKVPAVFAMEWSIQLEKSLRSRKPGKAIEAILEIGKNIEKWDKEPNLTLAEWKLFGLIPGEDKLFLNAIFLRLGDAFISGDKQTKITIVRIFFNQHKKRQKVYATRDDDCEGIISKGMITNYKELLRRVKVVFDTGDVEERALALGLFGCWANLCKDSADIRYIVLSSLVSCSELEVRAALFAAGCLCEKADDFAFVFLEMLVSLLTSCETTPVRLAAGRAFAKLWCPYPLADRAYKTGLKLALDSSEEEFAALMLVSLSKIASRWTLLIPGQMEVILSFFCKKTSLNLQLVALRCLCFMFAKRGCQLPLTPEVFRNLLKVFDDSTSPIVMQCECLKLLDKVLLCYIPSALDKDILGIISKLFRCVKDIAKGSIASQKVPALEVLTVISRYNLKAPEMAMGGIGCNVASDMILPIIDSISLVVESKVNDGHSDSTTELEVKCLLKFLFDLVKENSNLAGLMLDKINVFIQDLVKILERSGSKLKACVSNPMAIDCGKETGSLCTSKIMLCLSNIVGCCIEGHRDELINQALNVVNLLARSVGRCSCFDIYTRMIYLLLSYSFITYYHTQHEVDKVRNFNGSSSLYCDHPSCSDSLFEHEVLLVEHVHKVLGRKDNWSSYKIGKYAACRGVWSSATLIFEKLETLVQSDCYACWLQCLAQVSCLEKQIKLIGLHQLKGNASDKEGGISSEINLHDFIGTLSEVSNSYLFSKQTLGAFHTGELYFQRWFLTLRANVLETVADVIKLLHTFSCASDSAGRSEQLERSRRVNSVAYPFARVSNRLKNLALECDLLVTSFIGMDRNSLMVILEFALSCSLLAFSTGLAFSVSNSHAPEKLERCNSDGHLYAALIQDLAGRLWHIDKETSTKLRNLLNISQGSLPHVRKLAGTRLEARALLKLCRYAVINILDLHNKVDKVQDDEGTIQIYYKDSLQTIYNVISIWMSTPFQFPIYFFSARPCLFSELYVLNEEGIQVDGLSITSGADLSLNLCLQLQNMPHDMPVQPKKLYCFLRCKTCVDVPGVFEEKKRRRQLDIEDWRSEDMINLNIKLLQHVTESTDVSSISTKNKGGDGWVLDKCVCFQAIRGRQGFSTCLLDSSTFPVGSYRIKWLSCCIDNNGVYWSLLPRNAGPIFTVQQLPSSRVPSPRKGWNQRNHGIWFWFS